MKIGLLTYGLDRPRMGIGRYTVELARTLVGLDPTLDISLLTAGKPSALTEVDGCHRYSLPGCRLLPALVTLGNLLIPYAGRRLKLDIIHDPTGVSPFLFGAGGAKRVVTLHDIFPLSIPGHSTTLEILIYRFWLPFIVPRLDAVITISQCSKQDICIYLKMPEEKITVIPEAAGRRFRPLDAAEIEPVLRRYGLSQPYILYVGSVEPRKNLLRLLEAYVELRKGSPACWLVIVGARNYWKSSPVAHAVAKQGLQDSVTFTGYVPDEDLPALYNAADLFCFPSLYEGFGLPVLEAMACGTPVITSNTASLPEVAGDAALLVDPYRVDEIAAAMLRVLEEPGLAQELREKGLARAQQFTWERTARQTIEVYERVLGERLL